MRQDEIGLDKIPMKLIGMLLFSIIYYIHLNICYTT